MSRCGQRDACGLAKPAAAVGSALMQCEDCLGTGTVLLRAWPGGALQPHPCWVCGGTGLSHCCEGERPGNPPPAGVHPSLDEE